MDDNAKNIEKAVLATLPTDRRATEQEVSSRAASFRAFFTVSDEDFETVLRSLHSRLAITMDLGTALRDEYKFAPWLSASKSSIESFYWERYRVLLYQRSWPHQVVNTLDKVTDDILDLTADPRRSGAWKRRGLVVGEVQSGKTAAYTALICKAADAGYFFIVLLTGTLEDLRRQTQERLDDGFVGMDSSDILQQPGIRDNRLVGVGHIDARHTATVFTSKSRDFNRNIVNQLGLRLASVHDPVLVVVKKNKKILENLTSWLHSYNADSQGKIDTPMLLIDDEADSASINTNAPDSDPTAINAQIRALLKLFRRSSYVGVTATPFANVFIDPDSDSQMLDNDLFPSDFIYTLESPNNYIGARAMFSGDTNAYVSLIEDAYISFPPSLRSTSVISGLPNSLIDALNSFVLANAVRDLRGEGPSHRSMLVNVSRFTNVQNQVAALLDAELREIQRQIRGFSKLATPDALAASQVLRALHDLWVSNATVDDFSWQEVQLALNDAAQPIVVAAVNQSGERLDYKSHRDSGLRLVAVGGNSLSRGLTLEGLCTSYFYRNSQMYDTLLQMGRWFGYRDGYADLCRLWLTQEAFDWYAYITEASEELRTEFKRMKTLGLAPSDFGLKVRAHPKSLIVTARNKMRAAETVTRKVSLSAQSLEAPRLRNSALVQDANRTAVSSFIQSLAHAGITSSQGGPAAYFWTGVPSRLVGELLMQFDVHPLNFDFQAPVIGAFLKRTTDLKLLSWDVAVPRGEFADEEDVAGLLVHASYRRLKKSSDGLTLQVSGTKLRVGAGGVTRIGLNKAELDNAKAAAVALGRAVTDKDYTMARARPLLLLYFIRGYEQKDKDSAKVPFESTRPPLTSIGLSFPQFDDSLVASRVEYRVNAVEWRAMFENEAEEELPEYDSE